MDKLKNTIEKEKQAVIEIKKSTAWINLITKDRDELAQKQLDNLRLKITNHEILMNAAKEELAKLESKKTPEEKTSQRTVKAKQERVPMKSRRLVKRNPDPKKKGRSVIISRTEARSIKNKKMMRRKKLNNDEPVNTGPKKSYGPRTPMKDRKNPQNLDNTKKLKNPRNPRNPRTQKNTRTPTSVSKPDVSDVPDDLPDLDIEDDTIDNSHDDIDDDLFEDGEPDPNDLDDLDDL